MEQQEEIDTGPLQPIYRLMDKMIGIIDGSGQRVTSQEYLEVCSKIPKLCGQYLRMMVAEYEEKCKTYVIYKVLPSLSGLSAIGNELLLRELAKRWSDYSLVFTRLSHLLANLDKRYCLRTSDTTLQAIGYKHFRKLVHRQLNVARDTVIDMINKEREGEQIDRQLLKEVIDIFIRLSMNQKKYYRETFETLMLNDTAAYYRQKSSKWILEDSCPQYMLKAEKYLQKERDRAVNYLHSSSEKRLVQIVQHELLVVHATQKLGEENNGCCALLRDAKKEDLLRICKLYHEIPQGLDPVAYYFKQHITAEGTYIVHLAEEAVCKQAANESHVQEQVLVRKILDLHENCMAYVNDCFMNQSLFLEALKEAFHIFCNKAVAGKSIAEFLAGFCDNILRYCGDEGFEETLEQAVKLVAYISDKDLCAEFFRVKLAQRLLFYQKDSEDHENCVLTMLKRYCNDPFTMSMESMLRDFTQSQNTQTSFEEYLHNNANLTCGIDLKVTVLAKGLWPSFKSCDLSLPPEMAKCAEVFKGFYESKQSKDVRERQHTWIHSLGTCKINANSEAKLTELVVSTYQAAVLLLFNTADKLCYFEILTLLNATQVDLDRVLYSLSCGKYKILIKEPKENAILPDDTFEFNCKFTDRRDKIKIPFPPVDEMMMVTEHVIKERKYAIDAAIVCIMKHRKVLGHQQLVDECELQLSRFFKPDTPAIKRRIEDLISRDYMERAKVNPDIYTYKPD